MCSANCVRVSSVNVQRGHGCSARLYISAKHKKEAEFSSGCTTSACTQCWSNGFSSTEDLQGPHLHGFLRGSDLWVFWLQRSQVPNSQKLHSASTVLEMEVPKVNGHLKISMRCFCKHWNRCLCTNLGSWPHVCAGVDKVVTAPGLAELKESLDNAPWSWCGSWRWSWAG